MSTVAAAITASCATSPPPPPPADAPPLRYGSTRISSSTPAGFEAYLPGEQRWVDPDKFLAHDKATRGPNAWPDASVFPPFEQTKEGDDMLLNTPDGPCEMFFHHTRWRRRADVKNFGAELRTYKACGTVFSREIGFAPSTPSPPTPTPTSESK